MAKMKVFIGISLFDDESVMIKRSEFDEKGNNTGDSEIQPRDVAEALNLKTANDELADYVDEVVNDNAEPAKQPLRGHLPDGFPGKVALEKSGHGTYAKVKKLLESGTLTDVDGVGPATAAEIELAIKGE